MKKVTMIKADYCPFCRMALSFMDELYAAVPEYRDVPLEKIDEVTDPAKAEQFDYRVVPTYFIDGSIVFTGVPKKQDIEHVFEVACGRA
jgi:thioredoxin 1